MKKISTNLTIYRPKYQRPKCQLTEISTFDFQQPSYGGIVGG